MTSNVALKSLVAFLLGHPDWRVRDRWTRWLAALNLLVSVDHLLPLDHDDPEVALRAAEVYRAIPDWDEMPSNVYRDSLAWMYDEEMKVTLVFRHPPNEWCRRHLRAWLAADMRATGTWQTGTKFRRPR